MTAPLVFVDVETDGLHPSARAWEIALIVRRPGCDDVETVMLVEIPLTEATDPRALAVGGFYERHPQGRYLAGALGKNAPRPGQGSSFTGYVSGYEAARTVARLTHGAHLVGVNPAFDARVLERLLRSQQIPPGWHYHLMDLLAMSVGWINAASHSPSLVHPPVSSEDLSRRCGVTPPEGAARHTALGDARWARRWWDEIVPAPTRGMPRALLCWRSHTATTAALLIDRSGGLR